MRNWMQRRRMAMATVGRSLPRLRLLCGAAWVLCLGLAAASASAETGFTLGEDLGDLRLSGSNSLRFEHYEVTGNRANSPYAETGWHAFNDLNLTVQGQLNAYDSWHLDLVGTANASFYRAEDRGLVPERLRFFYQSGTSAVPFRLELGDFYGYFSYRTLQASLKGVQLELHPDLGGDGLRHSLLFLSGASQNSWRHFQPRDNYTNAASWLIEGDRGGRLSLNLVHNLRDGDTSAGTLRRSQFVASLAGQKRLQLGGQTLDLEGELGRFRGDHDGVAGAVSGQSRSGTAIYLQAAGRNSGPLSYRLRFESYGQDYQPVGAAVTADRRAGEAHVGWKFANNIQLRGRLQHFRDGWQTGDPLDTKTAGFSLTGPFLSRLDPKLTGTLDAYIQNTQNRSRVTDGLSKTVALNLSRPLDELWNGRLGLFWQRQDDYTAAAPDTTTMQAQFQADRRADFLGFTGTVSPGLAVRKINHLADKSLQLLPTLSANLVRGPHQVDYSVSYEHQDALARPANLGTLAHNLQYRFVRENDTFGVGLQAQHRDPQGARNTASYLFSVYWTRSFGPGAAALPARAPATTVAAAPPPLGSGPLELTEFAPGLSLDQARQRLAAAGISPTDELPGQLVYETRLLPDFDERQRLVLQHANGRLTRGALIIDFDPVGRPEDAVQTLARIRQALLARFGGPDALHETGEVQTTLEAAVNGGGFVRNLEWRRPSGVLRFGVPRRLDRRVRVEVQFATGFPPPADTLWSLETVR